VRPIERRAAAAGRRQVDAVLARLGMLKERIDATEACIALDLDHRRNELVAYNLVRLCAAHGIAQPAEQRSLANAQRVHGVARAGCRVAAVVRCGPPCLAKLHATCEHRLRRLDRVVSGCDTLNIPHAASARACSKGAGAARRR